MSVLERKAVKNVRNALEHSGVGDTVIELDATARSAEDAAAAMGCELGAIVKSLVFKLGETFVLALIAGDRRCLEMALPRVFNLKENVVRPRANEVKVITGFTIGGVAPIGMREKLPTVIDRSFERFSTIYAAAGHPNCVFSITLDNLRCSTSGFISDEISLPLK